jgi:hypothetical protein
MALDELPQSLAPTGANRDDGAEKRLQAMRIAVEKCMEECDLHDEIKAKFFSILNAHAPESAADKHGFGPRSRFAKDATMSSSKQLKKAIRKLALDAIKRAFDEEAFAKLLLEKGLDEASIEEAVEIARRGRDEEEAEDRIPENAIHGGMHGHISGKAKDDFAGRFPDAARIEADPERLALAHDRGSKRARRQAHDQAARVVAGEASLARKYGENFTRIKTTLGRV